MQLKWIGSILLLGMALGYVVYMTARMQRQTRRLGAWCALLEYMRGQIACYATPLPEILARAPTEARNALILPDGQVSQDFAALCRVSADAFDGETAKLLRSLADEIGTIWRQEQLERLNVYIAALEKEKNAYVASLLPKLRWQSTLVVCGTLALILLMW